MPLCARIGGVDLCLFGPHVAHHVHRLSSSLRVSSPDKDKQEIASYPNQIESLTASPKGYRINSYTAKISHGRAAYRRAARALETGEALELPWARFWRCGRGHRWATGDIIIIVARVIPFVWTANVNTVVRACTRKRSSVTLTWGTTVRHVLRGEETIQLSHQSNGDVIFKLRSFSRPHALIAWLTYPLVVYLQHRFARDVAQKLDDIANQRFDYSKNTPPPLERGKARQESLRKGRRLES